jgi:hypothetical protein
MGDEVSSALDTLLDGGSSTSHELLAANIPFRAFVPSHCFLHEPLVTSHSSLPASFLGWELPLKSP